MATNGAFTARPRLVPGAFPESGKIGIHGPGKFEQDPLAEVFGKNHPSNNAQWSSFNRPVADSLLTQSTTDSLPAQHQFIHRIIMSPFNHSVNDSFITQSITEFAQPVFRTNASFNRIHISAEIPILYDGSQFCCNVEEEVTVNKRKQFTRPKAVMRYMKQSAKGRDATPESYQISPVSHQYLTSISPVSHQYLTSIYLTSISPESHKYLTSISPLSSMPH